MEPIGRKKLPHDGAPFQASSSEGETYFITICCVPRDVNQLAREEIWRGIDETIASGNRRANCAAVSRWRCPITSTGYSAFRAKNTCVR
jgi:hypothetical protein